MTWPARIAIGAALLLGPTALLSARHGSTPAELPDVVPGIWIFAGGPMGGGTTSSTALRDGAWQEALVWTGGSDAGDICTAGTSAPQPAPASLPQGTTLPTVTWRVAFRRTAFDGLTATIEVRWRRDVASVTNLEPSGDFEGAFTWRASEGDSRVLDLVRQVPAAVPGCDTQAITLQYRAFGPDGLGEAAIAYDLWLVQRLSAGGLHTRHLQTAGLQDDAVRFAFPTVGIEAPGLRNSMGPGILDVLVQGQLRGRVRRDGRIDLAVDAGRIVRARGQGLGSGSSGRTQLTVAPGETVELEPPPMYGGGAVGPYDEALRDARTAIRVRARRLW